MTRIRTEIDADRQRRYIPTSYETGENRFQVPCSICGKHFFFNDNAKLDLERVMTEAMENPFVCIDCENDYEDLAHQN